MPNNGKGVVRPRIDFSKIPTVIQIPNLIEVQKRSYERFLQMVTFQMLGYEAEFGEKAARSVMQALAGGIETVGGKSAARRLKGSYWVNRAFQSYRAGEYDHVPANFIRGVSNDPEYLTNRGLLAISLRSVVERIR